MERWTWDVPNVIIISAFNHSSSPYRYRDSLCGSPRFAAVSETTPGEVKHRGVRSQACCQLRDANQAQQWCSAGLTPSQPTPATTQHES